MIRKLWWMIHKDLVSESRARRVWPAMLLLGIVVALLFSFQMDLPPGEKGRIAGSLLWLSIFFAGMLAIESSVAAEREEGCWEGLLLYPVTPAPVYLAKLLANVVALGALEGILIPLFAVLADVPLAAHPWAMLLVAVLGNVGLAAVGTLLSVLAGGMRQKGSLLVILVLPLVVPVLLAAAEATRLAGEDALGAEWWRWVQLLFAFDVVFVAAGTMLMDFAVED
jgi:heme exporter protein B